MYQPKLLPKHIRALYFVKEHDGRPMTHHVRRAVEKYLAEYPGIEEILSSACGNLHACGLPISKCALEGPLNGSFVDVMPANGSGLRILRRLLRGKEELPCERKLCPGILLLQGEWKLHSCVSLFLGLLMSFPDPDQLLPELGNQ